jgi:hypothetical protein
MLLLLLLLLLLLWCCCVLCARCCVLVACLPCLRDKRCVARHVRSCCVKMSHLVISDAHNMPTTWYHAMVPSLMVWYTREPMYQAMLGARFSDAQLEQATLEFLHSCSTEEELMYDSPRRKHRKLTDREFSIWHIRLQSRDSRLRQQQLLMLQLQQQRLSDTGPESRSSLRVPRYVVERLLIDDVGIQSRLLLTLYQR